MNTARISLFIFILFFSAAVVSPIWARNDPPTVNDEGMVLVEGSGLDTFYADPGSDLSNYNRVMLLDATVAFKKNWKRNQTRGNPFRVRDRDITEIKEGVAQTFNEVFTKELVDAGYAITDEPAEDVLLMKPAIVDLDVAAPDVKDASFTWSFAESAGEMTLNLDIFDSLTDAKVITATDRNRDRYRGYMDWRNSVTNKADARRMMTVWAKALTATLDEARAPANQLAD